jgi:peptidoglycan hydrolase CwlO-like protein
MQKKVVLLVLFSLFLGQPKTVHPISDGVKFLACATTLGGGIAGIYYCNKKIGEINEKLATESAPENIEFLKSQKSLYSKLKIASWFVTGAGAAGTTIFVASKAFGADEGDDDKDKKLAEADKEYFKAQKEIMVLEDRIKNLKQIISDLKDQAVSSLETELKQYKETEMAELKKDKDYLETKVSHTKTRLENAKKELEELRESEGDLGKKEKKLDEAIKYLDFLNKKTKKHYDDFTLVISNTPGEIKTRRTILGTVWDLSEKVKIGKTEAEKERNLKFIQGYLKVLKETNEKIDKSTTEIKENQRKITLAIGGLSKRIKANTGVK